MINMMDETKSLTENDEKSIDDVFEEIVGPAGWAQWIAFIAYGPITICSVLPLVLTALALFTPQHRCFVRGGNVHNASAKFLDWGIINASIPKGTGLKSVRIEDSLFDSCNIYERYITIKQIYKSTNGNQH